MPTILREILESRFDDANRQITIDSSLGEEAEKLLILLNSEQIALSQATLSPAKGTTPAPTQSAILGKTTLWGVADVNLTLQFTEDPEGTVRITATGEAPSLGFPAISQYIAPIDSVQLGGLEGLVFNQAQVSAETQLGELRVNGGISSPWPALGIPDINIDNLALSLTVQKDPQYLDDVDLNFSGRIRLHTVEIPVFINIPIGIGECSLGIKPPGIPLPSLTDLAQLMGGNDIAAALPSDVNALTAFTLKYLRIQFDPNTASWKGISFGIESTHTWGIISGVEISQLALQLNVGSNGASTYITGSVRGALAIGSLNLTAMVPVPLSGDIVLEASCGQPLPGLGDLASIINADFAAAMPDGMSNIGSMILNSVSMRINPGQGRISYFGFDVGSSGTWVIIENNLALQNLRFRLDAAHAETGWAITGSAGGTVRVKNVEVSAIVRRVDAAGGWLFALTAPLPLPGLSDLAYMVGGNYVTEVLPSDFDGGVGRLTIYQFEMDFEGTPQKLSRMVFGMRASNPWVFVPGKVELTALDALFTITSPTTPAERSVEGEMTAVFIVADVDILLSATAPGTRAAGWQLQGSTGAGQEIPIGDLIADLSAKFGNFTVPQPIKDLVLDSLTVSLITGTKDFLFSCKAKFPVDGNQVDIVVTIAVENKNGAYTKKFSGTLHIGNLTFTLQFASDAASTIFLATFDDSGGKQSVKIKDLVANVSTQIADNIPASLEIELKDVLFAFSKNADGSAFLFGLDIGATINLSNLPLVGKEFPPDQTVGVDDLQLLVASRAFTLTEANAINDLIPAEVTKLPVQAQSAVDGANPAPQIVIQKGLNVAAQMKFGSSTQTLNLPVSDSNGAAPITTLPAQASSSAVVSSDNAKWFTVQRTFGPVHFERVGVQYQDAALAFLLDGSLSFAGLTLSLDGLSVGSPLNKFEPKFNLRGLGIDYSNGPVEIGGAFLRTQVQVGGKTYDEYDGAAVIKTAQFVLSAIGSYADLDGHPSLLIYAVLDYPLGGPAFFFVTGLAAGFGYNRSLLMPTIDQVAQFPLVAQAVSGQRTPNNLSTELQSLQRYIPPSVGDVFFAVGVKFTSFKIIDSFVLVTVLFGSRFELNLLGLSTLISPPQTPANVPPLSVVQMAVRASFLPDEGFLGVQAQLTSASYIFTRDCHLTGGFAFFSWFKGEHAGDFVLTLGGYHPNYNLPSHYPRVPRVGISWQVNRNLSIKGSAYFALTASALMAGGSLQATWLDGNLKAWFNAGADFIVSWKPYHYDARVYVNMGVSYTFNVDLWFTTITKTISVDVGADLHIWGPEFSGTAHIKLWIVSFDVAFGSGASQRPQAIGWDEFRTSFIPDKDEDVCSVAITSGLVKTTEAKEWIVNPKDFCLVTNSVIPSKSAIADSLTLPKGATDFGVGPMEVSSDNLDTSHTIKVSRIVNNGKEPTSNEFVFNPILKKVPAGLWGKSLTPSLNGQSFVDGALSGFEIRPKNPPAPGHTSEIARANLAEAAREVPSAYRWETFKPFTAQQADDEARREAIRAGLSEPGTTSARNRLLNDLGIAGEMNPPPAIAFVFTIPPQVGELSR